MSADASPASVLDLALTRPPTLGEGRLICFDGPAGSGKTTWARAVGALAPDACVIHMDDLYPGWAGLPQIDGQLRDLLLPLSQGLPGTYRRYDWATAAFVETVDIAPTPLLLLEGVGSGAARFTALHTLLVWVEAPHEVRMGRGLARDGDTFAPHWHQWALDEAELFAREHTRRRADLHVDSSRPFPGSYSPESLPQG